MKSSAVLALVLLPTLALSQNQNTKKTVPAVFNNARYVWVESMDGDIFTPTLLPADLHAIIDVQNAMQRWGRYVLCADRKDAELIFVVRAGRAGEASTGVGVGNPGTELPDNRNPRQKQPPDWSSPDSMGSEVPMGTKVMVGGAAGPPNDLLKVVVGNDRENGTQVWLRSEKDGLGSPNVPLFQQLKKAVDHDYPR